MFWEKFKLIVLSSSYNYYYIFFIQHFTFYLIGLHWSSFFFVDTYIHTIFNLFFCLRVCLLFVSFLFFVLRFFFAFFFLFWKLTFDCWITINKIFQNDLEFVDFLLNLKLKCTKFRPTYIENLSIFLGILPYISA